MQGLATEAQEVVSATNLDRTLNFGQHRGERLPVLESMAEPARRRRRLERTQEEGAGPEELARDRGAGRKEGAHRRGAFDQRLVIPAGAAGTAGCVRQRLEVGSSGEIVLEQSVTGLSALPAAREGTSRDEGPNDELRPPGTSKRKRRCSVEPSSCSG